MSKNAGSLGEPGSVRPGSRADREGLDGLEYVTGSTPAGSTAERLADEEQQARRVQAADAAEVPTAPAEEAGPDDVADDVVAYDEAITESNESEGALEDVDEQGRDGEPKVDWQGQPATESQRRGERPPRG